MKQAKNKRAAVRPSHVDVTIRGLERAGAARSRPAPASRPAPRAQPHRILAKPWEADPAEHLGNILQRIMAAAQARQFCNLSPNDCELLWGSMLATEHALASAECVVRQIAREHYGKEAEGMTVKDFADRQGFDS